MSRMFHKFRASKSVDLRFLVSKALNVRSGGTALNMFKSLGHNPSCVWDFAWADIENFPPDFITYFGCKEQLNFAALVSICFTSRLF